MKCLLTWLTLTALFCAPVSAAPQLQLFEGNKPQAVLAGSNRLINLRWRNVGDTVYETDIHSRTMQLTSATAVCVGGESWKKLHVLPGQTILESAAMDFPLVKAKTRFLVQWLDGSSNVVGSTDVLVYPTNLLAELGILMDHNENALGLYDPENELKPLLKSLKIRFVDLENMVAEDFRGKLAIVGPFGSKPEAQALGTAQIKILSENSVAVVWLSPVKTDALSETETFHPSYYVIPGKQTATVVAQPEIFEDLPSNPHAQLNLVYFCKLALKPALAGRILPSLTK